MTVMWTRLRKYIEGTPQMGEVAVVPDESNRVSVIQGAGNEDTSLTEGTVFYDIRFLSIVPVSAELIRLIINIEAQNDFYPGYLLIKRGIYYCSRMISKDRKTDYDLTAAVMICLGKKGDSGTDLLKLLNVLLSTETDSQDKCQILEEDFHIKMTQVLGSEVSLMCNLSKGVEEKGIEKGRQEGIQEGIIAMVSELKDLQIADSIILIKIQEKFHLAEETAKMYLQA